jgi:hypothetical protein
MLLRLIIIISLYVMHVVTYAQVPALCGPESRMQGADLNNALRSMQSQLNEWQNNRPIESREEMAFQVVVHIVLPADIPSIPESQIVHQIDVLNNDFNARNENIGRLPARFRDLVKYWYPDRSPG